MTEDEMVGWHHGLSGHESIEDCWHHQKPGGNWAVVSLSQPQTEPPLLTP